MPVLLKIARSVGETAHDNEGLFVGAKYGQIDAGFFVGESGGREPGWRYRSLEVKIA